MLIPSTAEVAKWHDEWGNHVQLVALARRGEDAPQWLRLAAAIAQSKDAVWCTETLKCFREKTQPPRAESGVCGLLDAAEALASGLEVSTLTAADAALCCALQSPTLRPRPAFDEPPRGTHEVRIGVMLVEDDKNLGAFGQLVLTPYFLPDANLALVRHPFNHTQHFADSTLNSFSLAAVLVRRGFGDSAALRDVAVMWSVGYASDRDAPFVGLGGASAGAAFATGLAVALRDVPGLAVSVRRTLGRIRVDRLPHLAVSAALGAQGDLKKINGLTEKLPAWLTEPTTATARRLAYVAAEQPRSQYEALYRVCPTLDALLCQIADDHTPQTAAQTAVIDALRHGETPTDADLKGCAADPASDLLSHAAKRYSQWSRGRNAHLATHFVPLTLTRPWRKDIDDELPMNREDAKPVPYKSLRELTHAHDAECDGYVLTGDPGSGKSTLLQAVERENAADLIRHMESGGGAALCPEVTVYIRLKDLMASSLDTSEPLGVAAIASLLTPKVRESTLPDCVLRLFEPQGGGDGGDPRPKVRFLFDGLNELDAPNVVEWEKRAQRLAKLARAIGGERVLPAMFATRTQNLVSLGAADNTVLTAKVEPWTLQDIQTYLDKRFAHGKQRAEQQALLSKCEAQPHSLAFYGLPFNLDAQCELFENGVGLKTNRAEMLGLVYWLRVRREWNQLDLRNPLLTQAFDRSTHGWLRIDSAVWQKRGLHLPSGAATQALACIAGAMWHRDAQENLANHERGQVGLSQAEVLSALANAGLNTTLDDEGHPTALAAAMQLGLLGVSDDKARYSFLHQLWGEFFAARALADAMQASRLNEDTKALLRAPPFARTDIEEIKWLNEQGDEDAKLNSALPGPLEESAKFAIEMLAEPGLLKLAITALIPVNLTLAARCAVRVAGRLEDKSAHQAWDKSRALVEKYGEADETLKDLRAELLRKFTQPVLLPDQPDAIEAYEDIRHRNDWGLLLGELKGDARFELREGLIDERAVPYLRPMDEFICLVGKENEETDYWIGDYRTWHKGASEVPMTQIILKGFRVSAFPVTNAEYRFFVEAGGYRDERWWHSEDATRWLSDFIEKRSAHPDSDDPEKREARPLQPEGWEWTDSRFAIQPVMGISWHEANAYAAWLEALEHGSNAGAYERIRLLTEGQWRAAAGGKGLEYGTERGLHRRQWPYAAGNGQLTPDPLRINFKDTKLGTMNPVGLFARGASPEGIEDLSGNCWEWTASKHIDNLEAITLTSANDLDDRSPTLNALAGGGYAWSARDAVARMSARILRRVSLSGCVGFRLCGWRAPIKFGEY